MSTIVPTPHTAEPDANPILDGPAELIEEYLALSRERRALEERLTFVRAELELHAAAALNDQTPRGRFVGNGGAIAARLYPTCMFDRPRVAGELQRMGKLSEVAVLQGPGLARYLAKEPVVAARLKGLVRMRKGVMVTAMTL